MRKFTIVMALSLAFACSTRIEQSQVVNAERARAEAIARRDPAAYARLVSPDLVVIDPDGEVLNRDDRIAAIGSGAASNTRRVERDVDVRVFGDLALVLGRSDSQANGELNRDFFMRVWANQDGSLKMVGAHYTRMSEHAVTHNESFGAEERAIEESPVATTAPDRDAGEQVKRGDSRAASGLLGQGSRSLPAVCGRRPVARGGERCQHARTTDCRDACQCAPARAAVRAARRAGSRVRERRPRDVDGSGHGSDRSFYAGPLHRRPRPARRRLADGPHPDQRRETPAAARRRDVESRS